MDSSDGNYSNGCFVTGYQLYVNGETKNLISGAMHTKVSSCHHGMYKIDLKMLVNLL